MKIITKIKLFNFKRFHYFTVEFDDKLNLLIGDNESGKSSILQAIDLVISGSRNKIETIGLENLLCSEVVKQFLNSDRKYENLPKLEIELFLNEQHNPDVFGRINSEGTDLNGLKLICEPNDELSEYIKEILEQKDPNFPFEYYSISFKTFADQTFTGYRKFLKHIFIDNSQMSSEYAMKEYVSDIYNASIENPIEKYSHQHKYREHKQQFKNEVLSGINKRLEKYNFALKTNSKSNLESDLTIVEDDIYIDNKGKGKQCFVKTELVLNRKDTDLDIVLMEEPENHLSHINMNKLIHKISGAGNKQIFIATHSDLISARLDLRKTVLLNSSSDKPLLLKALSDVTAKFFMKAPDNNILEFVLSKKVILVEGDAEYILMEALYQNTMHRNLADSDIHIISVDGTSFKRYMELANILDIKTAAIRDNDGDFNSNCVENYADYIKDSIQVFADRNNSRSTFEVCLYQDNKDICEKLFSRGRRTLSVQDYMLKNKAEAAFCLLVEKANEIVPSQYIIDAIKWISE